MEQVRVCTTRLWMAPQTMKELRDRMNREPDAEMQKAYGEMIGLMERLPGREEWGSDWKLCLLDGTVIGGLGFKGMANERGEVELGYGIDEAYRRQGYATEAVGGMTRWALEQPDVRCVCAQTESNNLTSQRVLLRNGFVREGDGPEGPMFKRRKMEKP